VRGCEGVNEEENGGIMWAISIVEALAIVIGEGG